MDTAQKRRPGDLIINRYMPHASEEEREKARENLYAFVTVLVRIATRLAHEECEQEIRLKGERTVESESA
jgi:hypothetical protein